jgi:hypothetical protein
MPLQAFSDTIGFLRFVISYGHIVKMAEEMASAITVRFFVHFSHILLIFLFSGLWQRGCHFPSKRSPFKILMHP